MYEGILRIHEYKKKINSILRKREPNLQLIDYFKILR